MFKRIIALLLVLCTVISVAPICVGAAESEAMLAANDVTVTQGDYAYIYIDAQNFQGVASLDLFVYYDHSAMSVSWTSNGYMLDGAQTSVNKDTAGTVKLSAISLDGINGSGQIMTIAFKISDNAPAGDYSVSLAIGDAYDTNLMPTDIKSTNGSIKVKENTYKEVFNIYGNLDYYTVSKGDTFSYYVNNSEWRSFTGAEFIIEYDYEIFEFDSLRLADAIANSGAIYSVNSSVLGQVRLTLASTASISDYNLFTVNLRVVGDTDTTTEIKVSAQNVYKEDLTPYMQSSHSNYVAIKKLPQVIDYPDLYLETGKFIVGEQNTSTLYLEKGAGIAAGDFTVSYDPSVFRCVDVKACDGISTIGGMLVLNSNFTEGKVRFSYINMEAYDEENIPFVTITWEPLVSPEEHYQLTLSGVGVVDAEQNKVTLEYVTDSSCIHVRTDIPANCTDIGRTNYSCSCGDNYDEDIVPALGHDEIYHEAREVTCVDVGWYEYVTCSRCDYSTYDEIAALGHDEVYHEAKTPNCTDIGWDEYLTCTRCEYTTYVELPALGHRVMIDGTVLVDSIATENDFVYPFLFEDGIYSSTNKTDSTESNFTITALYDCSLDLSYAVSSEESFDKLIFKKNNNMLFEISGEVSWTDIVIDLAAGEVLTISYRKDGSVERGEDTGWFSFSCEKTEIGGYVPGPAEDAEPTCTDAVVCYYCQTVVKEALGHDEVHHEGKDATCLESGWNEYVTCTRCDYTTYEDSAAFGHDEIHHEAKAPTCLEKGWYEYVECSRCDYTTYVELPALGHRVLIDGREWVDSITYENDATYPFAFENGIYSSTNHSHNSDSYFTITALYDCSLNLSYAVSSETNYDKLIISNNGEILIDVSGEIDWTETVIELIAGDILTINYHKDGSAESGSDIGWFSYSCDQTEIGTVISGPTEEMEPTCTEAVVCYYCQTIVKEALGHDEVHHEGKDATCLESGWNEYVTCTRCDYSTYEEITALGHDEVFHEEKAPDCTEVGWNEYIECSRCDYTTYVELPALGHRVMVDGRVWVDSITYENDSTYPFAFENGKYSSTNHDDNTESFFTITALYDCSINLSCAVSSEENWDKLFIRINGSELNVISGEVDWTETVVGLAAGDVVTISYYKDSSAQNGQDTGWFYFTCEQTAIGGFVPGPAEDAEPTCTEAVVCYYCQTIVKEALGHDEVYHDGKDATCLEIGWNAYETCTRCDYSTYEEIAALDHNSITYESKDATCLENGWYEYEVCTRCDYTTYEEIAPLGHDLVY